MFWRLYQYSIRQTLRQKMTMFWNLLFPIILGTLFRVSFGDYLDTTVVFQQIPVAYVAEEGADSSFEEVLNTLEKENGMLKVIPADKRRAETLLKEDKVEGIYYNGQSIRLIVECQEVNQSILSSVLEQYQRLKVTFENIGRENPAGLEQAWKMLKHPSQYLREDAISDSPKNMMTDYFYALIAMNCLMGVTMGLEIAVGFKANLSNLAARKVSAGVSRFRMLLPDLAAKTTIQYLCAVCSTCYLMYVMKISLGQKTGLLFLTVLLGSMTGIFLGFFIGGLGTYKKSIKEGICISIMMLSSFLGGLMVGGIYRFLENHAPVVNRINPASLMVNALYSLNIYEGYEKYTQCMGALLAITALLGAGAFAAVRRERYASI